jgi:hypothetical protein
MRGGSGVVLIMVCMVLKGVVFVWERLRIFSVMKKCIIAILYYLVACFLVVSIGPFVAANLEGTSLDRIVYLAVPVMSLVLLVRSIVRVKAADQPSRWLLVVHVAGTVAVGVLVWCAWGRG